MNQHKKISFAVSLLIIATACFITAGCATRSKPIAHETLKPGEPNPEVSSQNEEQTKFGIFLIANAIPFLDTRPGQTDVASVKLLSTPVISEKDLISYDFSTHTMKLRNKSFLNASLSGVELVRGMPFVVVANGQRIYLGKFTTIASSISVDGPSICISGSGNLTVIDLAYPSGSFTPGPDPRNDTRIKSALASLHKLQ